MTVRTPHVVKDDRHWLNPPDWWKKFKPLRWLAILTIIAGLGSGVWGAKKIALKPSAHPETARYLAREAQKLSLGAQAFSSYASVASVTARLDQDGIAWASVRNHRPDSERYPPRLLDTIKSEAYTHLGVKGRLQLEFFNDRLYEFYFEPKDPAEYSRALYRAEPTLKRNRLGKVESVNGSLRIATNVDLVSSDVGRSLRTKAFAVWQDLRLVKQQQQWDENFGSIPTLRD